MTTVVITPPEQQNMVVSMSGNTVIAQQPVATMATIAMPGPQGPAFAGQHFFDMNAMEGLTVADSGVTVKWNGTQFVPASELGSGLTLNGGAF